MAFLTARLPFPRSNSSKPMNRVISKTESLIPFSVKKQLLEKALNQAFAQPLADDEFYFLEDHQLGLEVTDLGIKVVLSYEAEQLVVRNSDSADAWVKGEARDFLKLANREQDPDTLFFQRRLLIEGNTELGLAVKNLLDSIDWDDLPQMMRKGVELVSKLPV